MRRLLECLAVAVFSLAIVQSVFAAVPASITVQGKLTDSTGVPLPAGPKSFNFKIFPSEVALFPVWPGPLGEPQVLASDASGLWIALMGAISPLTEEVFADTVRWLEVTVDGVTLPRVRLATGPYAHRVATVDGASGGTITSKVSIGPGHTNTGDDAFVAGVTNTVSGQSSTIPGGKGNIASGDFSAVSGGEFNEASGRHANVGGGLGNYATDSFAYVGSGSANVALAKNAVVAGGHQNWSEADFSSIGGGQANNTEGRFSTIPGGKNNIASGEYATVSGGIENQATGDWSTIGGGSENQNIGYWSTIGGGDSNQVLYGDFGSASATISGGRNNRARSDAPTVGGGLNNEAANFYSTVSGGKNNLASGQSSYIGGGFGNESGGSYSTVPGGGKNFAMGGYSFAAGVYAEALHDHSFVWNSDQSDTVESTRAEQFLINANNGVRISKPAGGSYDNEIGDLFKDNLIAAWGSVNADGSILADFGVSSIAHTVTGQYRITLNATATSSSNLAVSAILEVDAIPNSAATARLIYANMFADDTFDIYITNGSHVAVDNQFTFIVTAR